MGTVLENVEPFLANFTYATLLDEKGEEMHKSKGNSIEFEEGADRMGVDAMRWMYSITNPASNLLFGFNRADDVRRRFLIPVWNVYSFFVTYANIDQYDPKTPAPPVSERTELDRWILSELNRLVGDVTDALENFVPQDAARGAEAFVESLSNWYVRRSRRRFWKSGLVSQNGGGDQDKLSAYATLYEVLTTLSRLLAPIIPFLTEAMYQNLVRDQGLGEESIHLDDYPVADPTLIDEQLSQVARLAMRFSSLGRAARSKAGIKVRQPVEVALVRTRSPEETQLLDLVAPQVMDELNVRRVEAIEHDSEVASVTLQPNMPVLGPKYGRDLPRITRGLSAANAAEVASLVESGRQVEIDGFLLEPEEVLVSRGDQEGYATSTEAGYTVAVTTAITPELKLEGLARELVHRIQGMRRDAGFDIADHIAAYYDGGDELNAIVSAHGDYIRQETLSTELVNAAPPAGASQESHRFDGIEATIGLVKQ
jgi:isoleucyl-tRNA synthetase